MKVKGVLQSQNKDIKNHRLAGKFQGFQSGEKFRKVKCFTAERTKKKEIESS